MRNLFLSCGLLALLAGCACPSTGQLTHVVVVWAKKPGDAESRRRLIETTHALAATVPEVESVRVGVPLPKRGPFDDTSYDVALVMTFQDEAALAAYRKNAVHQKAAKEVLVPLSRKIVVYDYLNQ